ncbi:hypothetical protein SAMN05421743_10149 [Thalassobacillus cyri]|uniref:Uncharacterized protein n=1 Tax=Thalassobacillus cyri TaxID=571932 RepID=A0A1H3VLE3_9BACI|nr:hypothetical protein SAMN05421743_10149 [Thalassobacillus cyri]
MDIFYWFVFLVGFGFTVSGGISLISYMNLLPAGFTWLEYLQFVQTRSECWLFPIGIILMLLSTLKIGQSPCQ